MEQNFKGPGPEVIKLFSCSIQLSMKFFQLINVKMPTIVGILTFMSGKNSILGVSEPKKGQISRYFYTYVHLVSCSTELSMEKFITSGPDLIRQLMLYFLYLSTNSAWHIQCVFSSSVF